MISCIILTKNNQASINITLESVLWANELIVIDDYSTDQTLNIVKKYSAHIYQRHLNNDWSAQRNFGLKKAKNPWVLFIDSDEVIKKDLKNEIITAIKSNIYSGYYLKRTDILFGKTLNHGETANVNLLRLAKKNKAKWTRSVHEVMKVKGQTKNLKRPIRHYRHLTIAEFLSNINTYTSIDQSSLKKEGKRLKQFDFLKPIAKFTQNYIIRLGFLDGFQGLIIAYLMSLHSLIVRIKQWEQKRA